MRVMDSGSESTSGEDVNGKLTMPSAGAESVRNPDAGESLGVNIPNIPKM